MNFSCIKTTNMRLTSTLYLLVSIVTLFGCSKDFLKKYDKRIIGTWRITDVDRFGIGGDADDLLLKEGTFVFAEGGNLTYVTPGNITYQGTWDIIKRSSGDDDRVRNLQIILVNYSTQQVINQLYDDMDFAGTNHFKARIYSGLHTYVTHFRR